MSRFNYLWLILIFVFPPFIAAQEYKPLPVDKDLITGTLQNGIKYYIKVNKKPEKRAELRLAVNAGSVLENESQLGLAHFAEHMAFNGSKNFKKNELINYLESVGIKFGPEVNAYTSFDETVYMLTVPTDKPDLMSKAFLVLEDWAHSLSFDSLEVEKERGVIVEEWRLGRGAQGRMRDKQLPVLFQGSRYASRLPIGDKNTIETFSQDTLKKFYADWYRPDLMAVAAVGDFNPKEIEKFIKDHFEKIPAASSPRIRVVYPVPDHNETLFAIASDKEATNTSVSIYYKEKVNELKTESDYRKQILSGLFGDMLNERFDELSKLADPPFVYAYTGKGRMIRSSDATILTALVKNEGIDRGLDALFREAERVKRHGFTGTELERIKKNVLRRMEQQVKEKDKTESGWLIGDIVSGYLNNEPVMSIDDVFALYQKILPSIGIEELNALASGLLKSSNRVVMVNSPEKEGLKIPAAEELTKVIEKVTGEDIAAYVDKVSVKPLVPVIPAPSPIVITAKNEKLGISAWTLANGVKVVVKPTDFKNDEIVFSSFCPGGTSLANPDDYISASSASDLAYMSGVGEFSLTELQKALAGKIVNVYPYISQLRQGINGSASPNDAETMFQLIYSYFTAPRKDSTAFKSIISQIKAMLQNKANSPQGAFNDTSMVTVNCHHYMQQPWTAETPGKIDLNTAYSFYKDRFSDASNMTFVFVGAIDTNKIKPLIETYIGGLPAIKKNETWKDAGLRYAKGVIEKTVIKGIEPKSTVGITFTGPFKWNRKNEYIIESLVNTLNIRLRETIREDKSGTYGISVGSNIDKFPAGKYSLEIEFGCNPQRVEELTKSVFSVIDSIKKFGPSDSVIIKVKATDKNEREVNIKRNGFWKGALTEYLFTGDDPNEILNYPELVSGLKPEDIKKAANEYLKNDNYVKVVLLPEK